MKDPYSNFLSGNDSRNFSATFRILFSLAICLPIFTLAATAAPANDNFLNAQVLSGNSGTVNSTNVAATKEPGEQAHALNRGGASVWYKFVAPGNGVLRVDTLSSGFNTLVAIYSGTNLNNLTLVAANDEDDSHSGSSKVYIGTQTGVTYYIAVDGKYFDASGVATGNGLRVNYSFDNVMPNDNFANATALRNDLPIYSATLTNVGASKEIGEPNHPGNAGGKSVWFSWQSPSATVKSYTFTLDRNSVANPAGGMIPLFTIFKGSSLNTLTYAGYYTGDRIGKITLLAQPGTTYYIAVDGYDFGSGAGAQLGNFMLTVSFTKSPRIADFDRDGRADITVYRPTTGTFYSLDSVNNQFRPFQWGLNGDKPMLNEVDADGKPDYQVFRPDTQTWYTNRSYTNTFAAFNWGISTDIPLTTNFYSNGGSFGFGTVFRQSTGTWWIYRNGLAPISYQFGLTGDIPMTFDFDGDGTDEIAVFRPSNGTWYIANPFTGQFINAYQFGQSGDVPVPADYDGDGNADIAVFRPTTGTWWFLNEQTGTQSAAQFAASGDKPQPADYDGDGLADLAVFRNGVWWIRQSSDGNVKAVQFGLSSDIPLTSPLY